MSYLNFEKRRKYFQSEVSWASHSIVRKRRPMMALAFLLMYIGVVVAFVCYATTVPVPVRVDAFGRLTSSQQPVPIRAPASFVVGQLLVKENQLVKKDEILMSSREMLTPESRARMGEFLSKTKTLLTKNKDPYCAKCLPEIAKLATIYYGIKAEGEVQALITPVNDHLRELSTAVLAHNQIEPSIADLRMNIKLNEQKLAEISRRKARDLLLKEVEQLETSVVSDKARIKERYQNSLVTITRIRSLIEGRLVELNSKLSLYDKTFNVVAPFAGRITNLIVKGPGEVLSGNNTLLEIVPAGTELIARVEVRNEDISQVQPGASVIVSIDALPEVDYGTLTGKVLEIQRVENVSDDLTGTKATRGYPVLVKLPQQYLVRDGLKANFMIGMSVQARIVSEYQTLFNLFMKEVVRVGAKAGVM